MGRSLTNALNNLGVVDQVRTHIKHAIPCLRAASATFAISYIEGSMPSLMPALTQQSLFAVPYSSAHPPESSLSLTPLTFKHLRDSDAPFHCKPCTQDLKATARSKPVLHPVVGCSP